MNQKQKNIFTRIKRFLEKRGKPDYRYTQITNAIFEQRISNFEQIQGLPKKLRKDLTKQFPSILQLKEIKKQQIQKTAKILFSLDDQEKIESVLMNYSNKKRNWKTVCLSTQVGCRMGCKFCSTGKIGLRRNLTTDEIISQLLYFHLEGHQIYSISFMGMGEPFDNPNIFSALKVITNEKLFNIGERKINLSTVGIVTGIKKLSETHPQINLAFSLHTPFEKQRKLLIPASRKYSIKTIMSALRNHIRKNNRKVFIAYMLIKGVNDTDGHLSKLKGLIKSQGELSYLFHVNLIKYNPNNEIENFKTPPQERVEYFKQQLEAVNIQTTLRQSFGSQIDAACGQLSADY
jgi:23S rRNA (adenine-C8)-methyltransferase